MNNDITMQMIGINDPNITYDDNTNQYDKVKSNGTATVVWNLKLTYPRNCENCNILMNNNGLKKVSYKGPTTAAIKYQADSHV